MFYDAASKGSLFVYSVVIAILIQTVSMGFLESSVAGNTPVLGNILFVIDIGYLIYYMHGDITVGIVPLLMARFLSIAATLYTVGMLSKIAIHTIGIEESLSYKLAMFGLGVGINFLYLWCFSNMYSMFSEALMKVSNRLFEMINSVGSF